MNEINTLRALAEDKENKTVTKATTFRVDPKKIKFEKGFNLRADGPEKDAHIERLYQAMKGGAQIPPIDVSVVEGEIYARTGHCRTTAAMRLRKEFPEYTLECRQFRGNDQDAVIHMLGSDTGAKPLSPLEAGIGFLRLTNFGMNPQAIADKLGISVQTVNNGLVLAGAPAEVQQMVAAGEVSATTAREVVKKGKEAVADLKKTVEAERAAEPKKDAKGKTKKKKVTAKKLKGTKAETGKKKKAKKKKAADPAPNPGEVTFTFKKDAGEAVCAILRSNADDPMVKEFLGALEIVLM